MAGEQSRFVVSADWVQQQLGADGFKLIDASWYLPAHQRDAKAEYEGGHVPGAVFFDQDEIVDHTTGLPHSLPAPDFFAAEVGKLGISATDLIVVYDGPGFFSAPRVWWMLRVMGAENVYILDGGLDGWKAESRPVETGTTRPEPAVFTPRFDARRVTSFHEMSAIAGNGEKQIADARPAGRFTGEEPEPRAGMRSGHMPGARSVPALSLSENGHLKDLTTLRTVLTEAGIDLRKPVVTSCGSGVTAAVITLALDSLGHSDNSLYDGSWSEWGSKAETAIDTGPAAAVAPAQQNHLTAHVTLLEMTAAPKASMPVPVNIHTAIMRATEIPLPFYRYLQRQVGARWHWFERLRMNDEALKAIIHDPKVTISVLHVNGAPAGFYEFRELDGETIELSYFGLMEHALGLGIGKWFLLQALYAVWQSNPKKVTVSTNTLDHPRALQLYQRYGFSPVETYDALVEPLAEEELLQIIRRDTPGL
ncbi:3-mercaptopyruvate sulfurtransferase [Rhizobium halophytocola]|uniref:Thiosulfate/3-mercaptopyruvate sulfurtransferase n=1 Tax=Rhizobium halophytocola TaxID=735519 RepID=A0ABS4DVV8_9HYPH|nr:3-mercaptopyruvate sulfurtransferase [Rhizobium halophytocola]MBP1849826.1 thiosulfate/3-mercaptopyruvate sulfurtransferase [Rhizobium halophytocola]